MKVSVLASGSKGNCNYIKTEETSILLDIGVTCMYVEKALKNLGEDPKKIEGVFITHTHSDHIDGLKVFVKKYNPKVYLTPKMYKEISKKITLNNYIFIDDNITLKDLKITAIKTSHDVDDSNAYIVENKNKSLVYLTDTGYINIKNHKYLKNRNFYIFESNHDIDLLMNNKKYPYYLKQRILGDKGHLSNKDSAYYLTNFIGENTEYVILAHLSEENNTPKLALDALKKELKAKNKEFDSILIASQYENTELIEV